MYLQAEKTTISYHWKKHIKHKNTCTNKHKYIQKKVQVGKDQEKAQSEKDSHSKNRGGKKTN